MHMIVTCLPPLLVFCETPSSFILCLSLLVVIALLGANWGRLVELVVLWMLLGALSLVVPLGFVLALV